MNDMRDQKWGRDDPDTEAPSVLESWEEPEFNEEEALLEAVEKKRRYTGTQLLMLIQISVCGLIVLVALFLKLLGGNAYTLFGEWYHKTLGDSIVAEEQYEQFESVWKGFFAPRGESSEPASAPSEDSSSSQIQEGSGSTDEQTGNNTSRLGEAMPVMTAHATTSAYSTVPVHLSLLFASPLEQGTVTSTFGKRENPFTGEQEFHPALDIAADEGETVFSVLSGKVLEAQESPSYGNYILLDHGNGVQTRYAHLSALLVEKDQEVLRGEPIGRVGMTGNATGYHLHLELLLNGVAYDPTPLLERNYI